MAPFKRLRSVLSSRPKNSASQQHESPSVGHSSPIPATTKQDPKERPKGLTILKNFASHKIPSCSWDPRIDVVAIHGLNGHAINTWMDGETIWFRDLLPILVPEGSLRIATYGYSSEIISPKAHGQMLDFVLGLLSALETLRSSTDTSNIPIFFICHSLGGILFKKCLVMANERKKMYGSIVSSTKGVAFFGTPHRGSGAASLMTTCLNITSIVYRDIRSDLVENLERTAEELADIGSSSPELLEPLSIISAYETRALDLFRPAGIIVTRDSALLDLSNEMAIPVDADHRAICRFSSSDDTRFRPVLLATANIVKEIVRKTDKIYQACLNLLYFKEFQQRRLLLPDPHQATFKWIWSHTSFIEWRRGNSKMLWLQGKPASGKSTMMKFIRDSLANDHEAGEDSSSVESISSIETQRVRQHIVVDFFYSTRGTSMQQEHIWMLKSILWQILSKIPSLWPDYLHFLQKQPGYDEFARLANEGDPFYGSENMRFLPLWGSVEHLQDLLVFIGSRYQDSSKLTIYVLVDAMDESELLNRRKIATSLLRLASHPNDWPIIFKVLVASRPDPNTDSASDKCVWMLLETHTDKDIELFVQSSLARLAEQLPSLQNTDRSIIHHTLVEKCQGIFLWVKLILMEFEEKYHREGCTMQEMEEILKSIPPGLDALYARMILPITLQTDAQKRETEAIFSWSANHDLSHETINDVIAIAACGEAEVTTSILLRNRLRSTKEIEKRVASRCLNFLEWTPKPHSTPTHMVCQYIHTTALEFISRHYDVEVIVDRQAEKYVNFVVNSELGWPSLVSSWPTFELVQLKAVNISYAIELCNVVGLPLFTHTQFRQQSRNRVYPREPWDDISEDVKLAYSVARRFLIAMNLAAAVQVNFEAIAALGRVRRPHLLESLCFDVATKPKDQSYISYTAKSYNEWFDPEVCKDPSINFERQTRFCNLLDILTMSAGRDKLQQLRQISYTLNSIRPNPRRKDNLFYFLSAARRGDLAAAELFFDPDRTYNIEHAELLGLTPIHRTQANLATNIISVALDFDQEKFASMMFEKKYVEIMGFVDFPDREGQSALYRACKRNLVNIARAIWPHYADPWLNATAIDSLRESARSNGYMEIVRIFETKHPKTHGSKE